MSDPIRVVNLNAHEGGVRATGATTQIPPQGLKIAAIQAHTNTVFGAVAGNVSGVSGTTLYQGQFQYGRFTSVAFASGEYTVYYDR